MLSESSRRRSVVPFSTVVLVSSGVLTHYDHKGNVVADDDASHLESAGVGRDKVHDTSRGADAFVPGTLFADLLVATRVRRGFSSNEQEHLLPAAGDTHVALVQLDSERF